MAALPASAVQPYLPHRMSFLTFALGASFVVAYFCSPLRLIYYFVQVKRGKLQILPGSRVGFVLHLLGVGLSLAVPAYIRSSTNDGNALSVGVIYATVPLLIICGIAEAFIKKKWNAPSRLT